MTGFAVKPRMNLQPVYGEKSRNVSPLELSRKTCTTAKRAGLAANLPFTDNIGRDIRWELCGRLGSSSNRKTGNNYVVTIANNTEYTSYVEYGHRQKPGRDVSAIGKTLKANRVKGWFMLTVSEQELEPQFPGLLEEKLYTLLVGNHFWG